MQFMSSCNSDSSSNSNSCYIKYQVENGAINFNEMKWNETNWLDVNHKGLKQIKIILSTYH